tara:strand:- start:10169 stop:11224 length:1056 start_codon:yes stop_codon:yes gene_type:complete
MIHIDITEKLKYGCLKVSGDDAKNFLQGQLCNNINDLNLTNKTHQFNGYCSPKGRLLATTRVFTNTSSSFFMLTTFDNVSNLMKRLKMYVLRSRVTIEDVSKTIHFYGIWFDAQEVNKIEPAFEHIKNISFFVIKDSSELKNRGWVLSDATSVSILEEKLKVLIPEDLKFRRASEDLWHMSEVMSGFTWINKSQADIYVPQFINLDIVDGLSFDKGCYPGQEVIARLHFLGKNKKRSILATLVDNTPKVLARLLSPTVLPTLHRSPIYLNDPKGTEDQIGEIVSVTKLMNLENSKVDNLLLLILINLNALAHSQTEKNIKFLAIINDVKFEVKFLKSFALYNLIIAEMHRA